MRNEAILETNEDPGCGGDETRAEHKTWAKNWRRWSIMDVDHFNNQRTTTVWLVSSTLKYYCNCAGILALFVVWLCDGRNFVGLWESEKHFYAVQISIYLSISWLHVMFLLAHQPERMMTFDWKGAAVVSAKLGSLNHAGWSIGKGVWVFGMHNNYDECCPCVQGICFQVTKVSRM